MSQFTASFYLGNRLLGTTKWTYMEVRGGYGAIQVSLALFCPKCGTTWGRVVIHEHADFWSTVYRNCRAHTTSLQFGDKGGYFYDCWSWDPQDIPIDVLREDFLFLMSIADKTGLLLEYGSNAA